MFVRSVFIFIKFTSWMSPNEVVNDLLGGVSFVLPVGQTKCFDQTGTNPAVYLIVRHSCAGALIDMCWDFRNT